MTDKERALEILKLLDGLTPGEQLSVLSRISANIIVFNSQGPLTALEVSGQTEKALHDFTREAVNQHWPADTQH